MRRVALVLPLLVALALPPAAAARMSGSRALETVRDLAAFGFRPAGSANERRVGGYVKARLQSLGYTVTVQRFGIPGDRSRNVVGRTPGRLRAVLVAHMDGVRGTVAANDNGSGVAALLEAARTLRNEPGLLVAALGAEERHVTGSPHHLGSRELVRSLSAHAKRNVRLALSLDMVGVGSTLHVRGLEASPNRSARRALRAGRAAGYRVTYLQDSGSSDHKELTEAGMRAAWVQWRWDPCWHLSCDRPHRLAAGKLRAAGRLATWAVRRLD